MQNFVPQFNSHDRIAAYWLLQQWRRRAEQELIHLPLGNVRSLNLHMSNLNALDRRIKGIHAGMRVMAAGAGLL